MSVDQANRVSVNWNITPWLQLCFNCRPMKTDQHCLLHVRKPREHDDMFETRNWFNDQLLPAPAHSLHSLNHRDFFPHVFLLTLGSQVLQHCSINRPTSSSRGDSYSKLLLSFIFKLYSFTAYVWMYRYAQLFYTFKKLIWIATYITLHRLCFAWLLNSKYFPCLLLTCSLT